MSDAVSKTTIAAAIGRAMARANPEIEGDLMRELARENPVLPDRIDAMRRAICAQPSRRSKYVQGWRP